MQLFEPGMIQMYGGYRKELNVVNYLKGRCLRSIPDKDETDDLVQFIDFDWIKIWILKANLKIQGFSYLNIVLKF